MDMLDFDIKMLNYEIKFIKKNILRFRVMYVFYLAFIASYSYIIYFDRRGDLLIPGISIGVMLTCWFFSSAVNKVTVVDYKNALRKLDLLEKVKGIRDEKKYSTKKEN